MVVPTAILEAYPIVIVVKVNCPPLVSTGAIFAPEIMNKRGVIEYLGPLAICEMSPDEPCECFHNGIPMGDHLDLFEHTDFLSCYQGRSFRGQPDDVISVSDCELPDGIYQ